LVYGRNKHVINVFVRPEAASAGESEETRNGFHMETWTDGGMEFRAVSDLNEAELRQFVSAWRHG